MQHAHYTTLLSMQLQAFFRHSVGITIFPVGRTKRHEVLQATPSPPTPTLDVQGLPPTGTGGPIAGRSLLAAAIVVLGASLLAFGYWRFRLEKPRPS